MTIAKGINKTIAIAKQSGVGVPADSGGQLLRRVTSVFTKTPDTTENNEIVQHQQSTGVALGGDKVSGKLSGLLSAGSYAMLVAGLLRGSWTSGVTTGAIATLAAATTTGQMGTFTRSAGTSFLTVGFKIGDIVRASGYTSPGNANNARNALIIALSATVMTVYFFDGKPMVAKAEGDSVTIAVVGKKVMPPLTGQTEDYFSYEDWYGDVEKSELFTDVQPNQIDISVPASGNATFSCDLVGLSRVRDDTEVFDSATAATTSKVLTGNNGVLFGNGAVLANTTGVTLTINGNVAPGDNVHGQDNPNDLSRGRIKVTGSLTAVFSDSVLSDIFDAKTPLSLVVPALENKNIGTSSFVSAVLGKITLTGDAPDDGEKNIVRTYPFTAELNGDGGTALAFDQTIITIQDSNAS